MGPILKLLFELPGGHFAGMISLWLRCWIAAMGCAAWLMTAGSTMAQEATNGFALADFLLLPLRIHVLTATNEPAVHSTLTSNDVVRILSKVNRIWAQAGITFPLESLRYEAAVGPTNYLERAEANERGLAVANKPDSYDICFIPEGDTQDWLSDKVGKAPGNIVDREGNVLGAHQGTHEYTVGQRKGLSIGRPAADGKPRYVLEIRPKTKTVVVGPQAALAIAEMIGTKFTWCGVAPAQVDEFVDVLVQVRAHGDAVEAQMAVVDGEMVIRVKEPIIGVAPGQTAVVYLGTRVLGQTTIDRTVSAVPVSAEEVSV